MIFRQLFDKNTWTYTYLLADPISREAAFIDPVNTHIDDYLALLKSLELELKYSFETHVHADHITASGLLRQHTGAQTCVSHLGGAQLADIQLKDGDLFRLGESETIKAIATPGHTPGCTSYLWRDRVFTGDSLFIAGCGRTDFQGGSAATLYDSITQRLFTLTDDTLVYPGHDYNQRWVSNIVQERTTNQRLAGKSRAEFIEIMGNLNLPKPRLIDESVPANRYCGLDENERQDAVMRRDTSTPVRETLTAKDLVQEALKQVTEINIEKSKQLIAEGNIVILDTREESEFAAGHIANSVLLPRGVLEFRIASVPELADKNKAVLIYCRSGNRSALAALNMQRLGYTNVLSMAGGYEAWQKA